MSTSTTINFIRIANPDAPIVRIFPLWLFEETLRLRQLALVAPKLWEDPHEDLTSRTMIVHGRTDPTHKQYPLAQYLDPAYAQCWSNTGESDALQRAYSRVILDSHSKHNTTPREEGVTVCSTPRKLFQALQAWSPTPWDRTCFVGAVRYTTGAEHEQIVEQEITSLINQHGLAAMKDGHLRAELLLMKRRAFQHEDEVRLIYIEGRDVPEAPFVQVPIDPNSVFDVVTFDPRLTIDRSEREAMARRLGYTGRFGAPTTYNRIMALLAILDD